MIIESLRVLLFGMIGVFAVMMVIMLALIVLNYLSNRVKRKKDSMSEEGK
jgi:hypothetical protein